MDRLGELRLLADQIEFGAQPGFKFVEDGPAFLLPDDTALIGAAAADTPGASWAGA